MPICNTCRVEKPVSDFSPNRWTKSGHTNKCRVCCAAYAKVFRQKNPDKVRKWERDKWTRWRAKTPFKRAPKTTPEGRLCTRCRIRKPDADYGSSATNSDRLNHSCKECLRAAAQQHRYSNLELARARDRLKARSRYAKNRDAILDARVEERLKYRYGLSQKLLADLLTIQGGQCAICERQIFFDPTKRKMDRANVDHDHATGAVRGLLCLKCNNGLGSFEDKIGRLFSAMTYLTQHREAVAG